ncbi:MAG: addiction module protein [Thermoanaerobaculia bacterium]
MKPEVDEVVRQALKLDEHDRAEVAARLLDSLEQEDAEEEDAWVAELERRAVELESGAVQGLPGRISGKGSCTDAVAPRLIFHPEAAREIEESPRLVRGSKPLRRARLPCRPQPCRRAGPRGSSPLAPL